MDWRDYKDIFEPFDKLIKIEIEGNIVEVPENNSILRCFQFLSMESISFGDFCWNGDCANCQIWLDVEGSEKPALSCRTRVAEGMKIVRINREIKFENL